MSVLGVGIDIVSIPAFAEQLKQPGTTFGDRFTTGERRDSAGGTGEDARHLAARWAAKEAVNRSFETTLREGLLYERRAFHALFATEDQKEGMSAFAEKREAQFRDR